MKVCLDCKEEKPNDEFYRTPKGSQGIACYCKLCQLARNHKANLKKYYGTSFEEWEKKLVEQNGVCAICGKPDNRGWRLSQDHNHSTKELRGLLCSNCNTGLGLFKEDFDLLIKAASYIRSYDKENKSE
jgi:hypothetical protein